MDRIVEFLAVEHPSPHRGLVSPSDGRCQGERAHSRKYVESAALSYRVRRELEPQVARGDDGRRRSPSHRTSR